MRTLSSALALAACAGLAALAGGAPATPAVAQDEARQYPTYDQVGLAWARSPSVRDMARFYRTTRAHGRRGVARTLCTPDAEGRLDCEILSEDPMGAEFGLAAVRVMERARVRAVDGGSPAGRSFEFGVRFGNWPASTLPDRFHPIEYNLLWARRPEMARHWNMQRQDRGEVFAATFDCTARADGSLDCRVAEADNARFAEAAARSMAAARVERADGGELAGTPLRWTIRVERQTNCGGGATAPNATHFGTNPGVTAGGDPTLVDNSAGVADDYSGSGTGQRRGGPACASAMVQVN